MRDINRLDAIYSEIMKIHKERVPDWRITQLFLNFFGWHTSKYGTDGWYIEEEEFLNRFKEFLGGEK